MKRVFISHPFSRDPRRSICVVARIARAVALSGDLPLAPHLLLPAFIHEGTERPLALRLSMALVALCEEVRVYGGLSEGVNLEVAQAHRLGIPVVDGETGEPFAEKKPPR